jgi:hypothetical protein
MEVTATASLLFPHVGDFVFVSFFFCGPSFVESILRRSLIHVYGGRTFFLTL